MIDPIRDSAKGRFTLRERWRIRFAHWIITLGYILFPGDAFDLQAEEVKQMAERNGMVAYRAREGGPPQCPACGLPPGRATFSTAPDQAVCATNGCPVNTWDTTEPEPDPITA